ncbi:MAG: RnfABCDGE type electron transport complex subunit D [Candidatus Omnitrophica bacterium]|nr:RnfABCDGE type electron transport complex subunit D [Candidatus Omnitrophota bacterium]
MIHSPNPQPSQYDVSPPPHIRSANSIDRIMLSWIISLLPVMVLSIIVFRWQAVKIFLMAVLASAAAEISAVLLLHKKNAFSNGSGLITAFLIVLLLPASTPLWAVFIAVFLGIGLGLEIYGGLGQNPFNPAAIGVLFLLFGFPVLLQMFESAFAQSLPFTGFMAQPVDSHSLMTLFYFKGQFLSEASLAAVIIGGLYLVAAKVIDWEVPFIYLGTMAVLCLALPSISFQNVFLSGPLWISAFYLITEYASTPINRQGKRLFALIAALITVLWLHMTAHFYAAVMAVLLTDMMVPWIDTRIKPKRARAEENG